MTHRHLSALLVFCLLASTGQAADALKLRPGMTGVADLGATSCEQFNAMYPFGPVGFRQAVLTWAQGYFYARSGKTTDELLSALPADASWNFDSLTGHVVNFCAANPDVAVSGAVAVLWEKLQAP